MKPPEVTVVAADAPAIVAVAEPPTLFNDLVMLTKARLTMLVLMTTAFGFGFGSTHGMDWFLFFRVMFGTAFVAASASVLNQFIERNVDRLMGRTKDRPLPAGRMAPGTALGLGVLLGVAGLIYLQNRVSPLCAELAGATLATYVALYTPLKRKSAWCVTVGAVSGAIPPMIGWAAATKSLGTGAWILFGILFFWQMPHFLALAWMYRDEYAQAGFFMLRRGDTVGMKAATESLLCSVALTVVTMLPAVFGMAHPIYVAAALMCDGWLLICAALFMTHRNRASARRLFLASILYLPLVMALLVLCPELMFTKRQTVLIYVVATLTTVFAGTVTYLELKPQPPQMQRFKDLPAFALTNQDGQRVVLDNLKGKVWLADFVYTTCPGPCPIISAHMAELQKKLPSGVQLVSFSTDPQNDTPAVLKAYAKRFGATDRWTFLTGPKEQVYDLINHGFLLAVQAPPGQPIIHSTRMALVDRNGTVRGFYDGATEESDAQIIDDIGKLLQE